MMKKNILLLMTDQHRVDYTGFSGAGKVDTPNIDKLAGSVAFMNGQTVNPICLPARSALITGKYPRQIGTLAMSGDLSLQHPTYMRALQKTGYHTVGVGKLHHLQTWPWRTERGQGLDLLAHQEKIKAFGYDDVWETAGKELALKNYCEYCRHLEEKGQLELYRDYVEAAKGGQWNSSGRDLSMYASPLPEEDHIDIVTADKIIEKLETMPEGKPFYLFGSFCSPHTPFDPPKSYLDKMSWEAADDFAGAGAAMSSEDKEAYYGKRLAYKALVSLLDDQVGRIWRTLQRLELLQDTVILFVSDHGEMLGDHGLDGKTMYWKQSASIPMAIRHPDYLDARTNHSPVEIIDMAATILDIAGLNPQADLSKPWPLYNDIVPARSLMPIVRGESGQVREYTFTECKDKWQMIQTGKWKYVRFPMKSDAVPAEEAFYDLAADPDEERNQIDNPAMAEAVSWCRMRRDYCMDRTPPAQLTWATCIGSSIREGREME